LWPISSNLIITPFLLFFFLLTFRKKVIQQIRPFPKSNYAYPKSSEPYRSTPLGNKTKDAHFSTIRELKFGTARFPAKQPGKVTFHLWPTTVRSFISGYNHLIEFGHI
jgi:hypothetical protein